jgi:hypothetical protein
MSTSDDDLESVPAVVLDGVAGRAEKDRGGHALAPVAAARQDPRHSCVRGACRPELG